MGFRLAARVLGFEYPNLFVVAFDGAVSGALVRYYPATETYDNGVPIPHTGPPPRFPYGFPIEV